MKKLLIMAALMLQTMAASAQDITLPQPDLSEQSASMVETLKTRHSVRSFSDKALSAQQLSNLCWAACGISRDEDHITAPSAMNRQEIRLFVFTTEGVYEYAAKENKLLKKADGDKRSYVAGTPQRKQAFVEDAPVSLVMVMDLEKFGSDNEHARIMTSVDAGIVCQNINLYCQSVGLATVPRGTMDADGIAQLLGLNEKQIPVMNNPVGYEK